MILLDSRVIEDPLAAWKKYFVLLPFLARDRRFQVLAKDERPITSNKYEVIRTTCTLWVPP